MPWRSRAGATQTSISSLPAAKVRRRSACAARSSASIVCTPVSSSGWCFGGCGTPYGVYYHADRRIVMNVGPGIGTLTHELVHPIVEADFLHEVTDLSAGRQGQNVYE